MKKTHHRNLHVVENGVQMGFWYGFWGSTLRGTFERRRLNALKDRSQPINLEMMKDPNILVNAVQ